MRSSRTRLHPQWDYRQTRISLVQRHVCAHPKHWQAAKNKGCSEKLQKEPTTAVVWYRIHVPVSCTLCCIISWASITAFFCTSSSSPSLSPDCSCFWANFSITSSSRFFPVFRFSISHFCNSPSDKAGSWSDLYSSVRWDPKFWMKSSTRRCCSLLPTSVKISCANVSAEQCPSEWLLVLLTQS